MHHRLYSYTYSIIKNLSSSTPHKNCETLKVWYFSFYLSSTLALCKHKIKCDLKGPVRLFCVIFKTFRTFDQFDLCSYGQLLSLFYNYFRNTESRQNLGMCLFLSTADNRFSRKKWFRSTLKCIKIWKWFQIRKLCWQFALKIV